jgi:hypothetical protein
MRSCSPKHRKHDHSSINPAKWRCWLAAHNASHRGAVRSDRDKIMMSTCVIDRLNRAVCYIVIVNHWRCESHQKHSRGRPYNFANIAAGPNGASELAVYRAACVPVKVHPSPARIRRRIARRRGQLGRRCRRRRSIRVPRHVAREVAAESRSSVDGCWHGVKRLSKLSRPAQ